MSQLLASLDLQSNSRRVSEDIRRAKSAIEDAGRAERLWPIGPDVFNYAPLAVGLRDSGRRRLPSRFQYFSDCPRPLRNSRGQYADCTRSKRRRARFGSFPWRSSVGAAGVCRFPAEATFDCSPLVSRGGGWPASTGTGNRLHSIFTRGRSILISRGFAGASRLSRFRHYVNLTTTERKLERLLASFRFGTMSEVVVESATRLSRQLDRQPNLQLCGDTRVIRSTPSRTFCFSFTECHIRPTAETAYGRITSSSSWRSGPTFRSATLADEPLEAGARELEVAVPHAWQLSAMGRSPLAACRGERGLRSVGDGRFVLLAETASRRFARWSRETSLGCGGCVLLEHGPVP